MKHEYAFDIKLTATIRVNAGSEEEARELLDVYLDAAHVEYGTDKEGRILSGEASLATGTDEPVLFELDGGLLP